MNKKRLCITAVLVAFVLLTLSAQTAAGSRIAVPAPKAEFLSDADAWVPLFAQGQITTNLQKYSTMTVIDRLNLESILKEQRLSESAAFSEATMIEAGMQLAAEYLANLHIIKKGSGYSLTLTVTDTTSGAILASVSEANASVSSVEKGFVFNRLSWELLNQLGAGNSALAELQSQSDEKTLSAFDADVLYNENLARGLAAQQTTGNIVEALAYFNKSVGIRPGVSEATQRLSSLTESLSAGSIGEKALNEIALRKQWEKIFSDFNTYAAKNCTYLVYSTKTALGSIDYTKETAEVVISYVYGINPDVEDLYHQIFGAYKVLGQNGHDTKNWKLNLEDDYKYTVFFDIYGENGQRIGTSEKNYYGSHSVTIQDYRNFGFKTATVAIACPADELTGSYSIDVRCSVPGGIIYAR